MLVYRVVVALVRLLLPSQMRLRVKGAENCPHRGALILVTNHLGLVDPAPIAVSVRRPIRMLAKSDIFDWPMLGGIAHGVRIVPVRRGVSDREALRTLSDILAQGQCVLLMPEGTYPKAPLPPALLPLKTGAAFLALRSGALVLPVALTGTERIWHRSRGWRVSHLWQLWRRPQVTLTFGEPYRPQAPVGLSTKAAYQAVAEEMGRRIAALLPAEYRGAYAEMAPRVAERRLDTGPGEPPAVL
jgi:1-acyl-sn-glycerol-3-phosphate acyltransferase